MTPLDPRRDPLALRMAQAIEMFSAAELTPEVVEKAKLCILDLLSSAFASAELPWSRQAVALATDTFDDVQNAERDVRGRDVHARDGDSHHAHDLHRTNTDAQDRRGCGAGDRGANGDRHYNAPRADRLGARAGIIGTRHVVSLHDAAFANAVLGHALVRDDMHLASVSHLGTVIVPAVLALAERAPVSGQDLLTAIVTGYEAGGKIGRAVLDVEVSKIFRPTGITGPIAAAAAGANLLGLERSAIASALAIAANTAGGYNEWAATGGSEMFFHVGFAARSAISAVLLAAHGVHASTTAIDGSAGLLAAFRKPLEPAVHEMFEDRAEILSVFFKPVPACNFAQAAAQASLAIALRHGALAREDRHGHGVLAREDVRGHGVLARESGSGWRSEVERIVVRVPYAAAKYPGCDCTGPFEHILQAKMSIHYNVAAALCKGNFDEHNYVPHANPDVLELAARTTLEIDDELTRAFPAKQGAEVIVHLRGGNRWSYRADAIVPASSDEVRARFAAAASAALGSERAAEIESFVDNLETATDAAELSRLTRAVADGASSTARADVR